MHFSLKKPYSHKIYTKRQHIYNQNRHKHGHTIKNAYQKPHAYQKLQRKIYFYCCRADTTRIVRIKSTESVISITLYKPAPKLLFLVRNYIIPKPPCRRILILLTAKWRFVNIVSSYRCKYKADSYHRAKYGNCNFFASDNLLFISLTPFYYISAIPLCQQIPRKNAL